MHKLLFQSNDKTAQECADWCDNTPHCNGFAVVDSSMRNGVQRCYLKHTFSYPPSTYPLRPDTLLYYRQCNGSQYTLRGGKWIDTWHNENLCQQVKNMLIFSIKLITCYFLIRLKYISSWNTIGVNCYTLYK